MKKSDSDASKQTDSGASLSPRSHTPGPETFPSDTADASNNCQEAVPKPQFHQYINSGGSYGSRCCSQESLYHVHPAESSGGGSTHK